MSSALLPATKIFPPALASGSRPPSFFSSTCDLRTASRARARCAALPMVAAYDRSAYGRSNSPYWIFLVRIRRFASSIRASGTCPACTAARRWPTKVGQSFGTMIMSRPALIAVATSAWVKPRCPSIWSMPAQSETVKPVKPSSPLSTSVIRYRWPCSLLPCQLLNEIITEPAPRWIAARNGGRWIARNSASLTSVSPWSTPPVVPPSPT
jgi:hypothetical protein